MREAAVASIPQSKNSHKISVPWWNKECALAVKNKKHAFNRMRRTRRSIDILIFKRRRAVARKVILAAKQQSWRNYCTSINTNSKLPMVWRTIKKFSGSPSTRIPQLEQNGIRANNNQHKANVLGNQFQAVSFSSDYPQAFTRNLPTLQGDLRTATLATRERDPRINALFSMDELKTAISGTKNTAPGHDQLCYEMFKHLSHDCLETVLFLFNNIWSTGVVPKSWLHSIVIPIYKPGKPSNLPSS